MNEKGLIEKFLPILVFHPHEKIFPMSIKRYISCCKLKLKDNTLISTDNFSEWVSSTSRDEQVLSTLVPNQQKMETIDDLHIPIYVSLLKKDEDIFITYYFFYRLNPAPISLFGCACCCGIHDADIEHVQVHIRGDEMVRVYFSKHSGGNWINKKDVICEGSRPVVYVALNTHACYERVGVFLRIGGLVPDFTGFGYKLISEYFINIEGELLYRGDYGNGHVSGFPEKSGWLKEEIDESWRC